MPNLLPVINIQCNWNDVLRLPHGEAWISSKYINKNSEEGRITSSLNKKDGKITLNLPIEYHLISFSNLSLVVKDLNTGLKVAFVAPTKSHDIHKNPVLAVSATESGLAVSSCEAEKLIVWDSRTNEQHLALKGHIGPVYICRFFPSGVVVISAGADCTARIWSAESGINPVKLKGHKRSIADICIVERGRNIITVSKDGTAKLWDVGESRCIANIVEGYGPINCCALTTTSDEDNVEDEREIGTGNKLLVVGCESGLVICLRVAKREEVWGQQLVNPCNTCIILEDTAIIGCNDGKIVYININDGTIINELHESANPVRSMTPLSNQLFLVGRQDGNCTVMSLQEAFERVRVQLTGSHFDGIRDVSFNGKWIFAGSRDSYIRKYDFNQVTVHFK